MNSDSESPQEQPIAKNTGGEADAQARQSHPDVPIARSIPPAPPAKPHYEITCKTEKTSWDKFKDGAEIVGICLLAVYTFYSIKMYCANKKAADAAASAARTASDALEESKRSSHLDQRAWLQIDPQPPQDTQSDGLHTEKMIIVGVKNTGKTPALHVRGHMKFQDIKNMYPYPSHKGDWDRLDFSYSNKPTFGQAIVSIPTLHPNSSFRQIVKGTHIEEAHFEMFVHGEVRYCDIFNEEHWAKFCFQWVPVLDHPQLAGYIACDKVLTMGGMDLTPRNAIDDPNSPRQCKEK